MISGLEELHFVRPLWLLGLLPVLGLLWMWVRRLDKSAWLDVIDPNLLPHLLEETRLSNGKSWFNIIMITLAWVAAILALAGPAWNRIEQEVAVRKDALVVVLDLSYSMATQDVPPSRIERARFKLIDLFKQRQEGQTAFIVYAGDTHVLVPFTDDTKTLIHMLPSLEPGLMPVPGSRVDLALEAAGQLLENSQIKRGRIILVTDDIDDESRFIDAVPAGHDLVVLGVGTKKGAPIPDLTQPRRGFLKDASGNLVLAQLDEDRVAGLVRSVGGIYQSLTSDESDLRRILPDRWWETNGNTDESQRTFDVFVEQGYWLLLLCVPIMLALFRRGVLIVLVVLSFGALNSTGQALAQSTKVQAPVVAPPPPERNLWDSLWWSGDQQGYRALADNDPDTALKHLRSSPMRALAYYLKRQWGQAGSLWQNDDSAEGHYNRGNALAHQGNFRSAWNAYNQALGVEPKMEDALHNKALMERLLAEQTASQRSDGQSGEGEQNPEQSGQQQAGQGQPGSKGDEQRQSDGEQRQASVPEPGDTQSEAGQMGEGEREQQQQQDRQQQEAISQGEASDQAQAAAGVADQDSVEDEEAYRSLQQWLRRIPDDPGGLLRRKFRYETEQRARQRGRGRQIDEEKTW